MKFLCDHMLVDLGKWLRIAGYDTVIIMNSDPDTKIYNQAIDEKRYLLTSDHQFLEMKGADQIVIYLNENSLEDCVKELMRRLAVNWLIKPFSRCLKCNAILIEASDEDLKKVPKQSLEHFHTFLKCPSCEKIYWQGSHTENMLEQLKKFNELKI